MAKVATPPRDGPRTKNVGDLESWFCFAQDKQTERLEIEMPTIIACDLANCDPTFRPALVRVVEDDNTLGITTDLMQWQ